MIVKPIPAEAIDWNSQVGVIRWSYVVDRHLGPDGYCVELYDQRPCVLVHSGRSGSIRGFHWTRSDAIWIDGVDWVSDQLNDGTVTGSTVRLLLLRDCPEKFESMRLAGVPLGSMLVA